MFVNRESDESGLSLIELIVGIVVSTIVLTGIASVLINSWLTQDDVLSTSEATNRGQLISLQIERAVRNGIAAEPRNSGTELWVHTAFNRPANADPRTCQAFKLGGGKAAMMSAPDHLSLATWGSWLDDSEQAWHVEVKPVGTAPIFSITGTTVTYSFKIETDSAPVLFGGAVSLRTSSMGATSPCWP
ncbi:MAG: PilW family protein [Microbacterium sp.]|uniref:PilW family protein n=1 Tax=Microbacterium sp. TaxID=51671 RepID=UPI003F802245